MISFKDFLVESRSAPLYHATRFQNAEQILKENVLKPSIRRNAKYNGKPIESGISLTRDIATAREWIPYNSVIFVLDQAKLTHRYKILPINIENIWAKHWDDLGGGDGRIRNAKGDQLREELITKAITDFDKYVIEIIVENITYGNLHDYPTIASHRKLKLNGKFVNK